MRHFCPLLDSLQYIQEMWGERKMCDDMRHSSPTGFWGRCNCMVGMLNSLATRKIVFWSSFKSLHTFIHLLSTMSIQAAVFALFNIVIYVILYICAAK